MFLGDLQNIETHLNNDWTILLKNIKIREDYHFQILQYNHKIINQVRTSNSQLFINDQIFQHHKQYRRIMNSINEMDNQQSEISQKYEETIMKQAEIVKLMTRVGSRILQIWHYSIDKCKLYEQGLCQKHVKIKKTLIEYLNDKNGINLDKIIKCVLCYSTQKLKIEVEKLKKLINALQNGDYFKLKQIYIYKQKIKIKSIQKKLDIIKDLSKNKIEKQILKTQQKNNQKLKKQRVKLMSSLYNTMDLSKQQFNDQQYQTSSQRIQKLYNQILCRNKFNSDQIIQFQSKKDHFQQKVRLFKEYMENQSKKIAQVFIRKPIKKQKQIKKYAQTQRIIQIHHSKSQINDSQNNNQNIMTQGNIDLSSKKQQSISNHQYKLKSLSNKKQNNDLPTLFNSFIITHENINHFKFDIPHRDLYSRINRNILPDISKGTSLDQKTQITKIKIDKILRTTIRNDDKTHEQNFRQMNRRTAIISRQQAKKLQQSHKFRLNFNNISFGHEAIKRNTIQKNRNEIIHHDNSLHVKKAQLKHYQPKLNIIF